MNLNYRYFICFDFSNFKCNSGLICILIFLSSQGVLLGLVLCTLIYWVLKEIIFCKPNHFLICSSSLLLISYHSLQFICFGFNSVFTWCNRTHPSHYHLKFFHPPILWQQPDRVSWPRMLISSHCECSNSLSKFKPIKWVEYYYWVRIEIALRVMLIISAEAEPWAGLGPPSRCRTWRQSPAPSHPT